MTGRNGGNQKSSCQFGHLVRINVGFLVGNISRYEERGKGKEGGFVWATTIVAVPILTQGIVRYIRDWYLGREERGRQVNPA